MSSENWPFPALSPFEEELKEKQKLLFTLQDAMKTLDQRLDAIATVESFVKGTQLTAAH